MELIFELLTKGHRQNTLHKTHGEVIRLGRAWDNDIILQDEQVEPYHARISRDPESGDLIIEDLQTHNGTWVQEKKRLAVQGSSILHSGAELKLGNSRLRVFTPDHPVDAALAPTHSERLLAIIGNIGFAIPCVIISLLLTQWLSFMGSFDAFKIQTVTTSILTLMIIGFGWATLWGLIGKISRHEAHFGTHVSLAFLFFIAMSLVSHLNAILTINHLSQQLHLILEGILTLTVAAFFLNTTLYLASPLTQRLRRFSAAAIATSVVAVVFLIPIYNRPEVSRAPDVVTLSRPDIFRWKDDIRIDEFLSRTDSLYEQAQEEAKP